MEGAVGSTSIMIIAPLRYQQFFSITELNGSIKEKLRKYNTKRKKEAVNDEEKLPLFPLPARKKLAYNMIICLWKYLLIGSL